MGFFGSKSTKEVPSNIGAETVTGPGAQHVAAPAHNLGRDVENPSPLVADAWVVEASSTPATASSPSPKIADPPPPKKFLPGFGSRNAAQPGAVAVPGPPSDGKSKIAVAVPEADARNAPLMGCGSFERNPAMLDCCPNCQQQSRTKVRTYPTVITWAAVVILFLLFWPLCWIPLVVTKCKATDHTCVKCNAMVGGVKPLEDICEKRKS